MGFHRVFLKSEFSNKEQVFRNKEQVFRNKEQVFRNKERVLLVTYMYIASNNKNNE